MTDRTTDASRDLDRLGEDYLEQPERAETCGECGEPLTARNAFHPYGCLPADRCRACVYAEHD